LTLFGLSSVFTRPFDLFAALCQSVVHFAGTQIDPTWNLYGLTRKAKKKEERVITTMSVGGPCAWVSTVPPAATAHPSTITSSWTSVSWNSEQGSSKSGLDLTVLSTVRGPGGEPEKAPSVEMQSTVVKAENAFPVQATAVSPNLLRYPEEDAHLNSFESQSSEQGDSLSRLKLERLNADDQERDKSPLNEEEMSFNVKSELSEDIQEDEKDHSEINAGSSDDGAGSSVADDKKASQLEKKKMKRFR
jgi:hypothetical protein